MSKINNKPSSSTVAPPGPWQQFAKRVAALVALKLNKEPRLPNETTGVSPSEGQKRKAEPGK